MHRAAVVTAAALVALLGLAAAPSAAPSFSPEASYQFCVEASGEDCDPDYYAGSVPEFRVHIEQDEGEEELSRVVLRVPPGFRFPHDRRLQEGEHLGTADISLAFGPACEGSVGSQVGTLEDRPIYERDRSSSERRRGSRAVFVVEVTPVIKLEMKVFGDKQQGYRVRTEIPDEPGSCPPLVFDAHWYARSATTSTPILRLPESPGTYSLEAIFTSVNGARRVITQSFEIV